MTPPASTGDSSGIPGIAGLTRNSDDTSVGPTARIAAALAAAGIASSNVLEWVRVQRAAATKTTVCVYDRAGIGFPVKSTC